MANSSLSSSLQSFNDLSSVEYTEEQEIAFYQNIKMNVQAIQKTMDGINLKLKNIQKEMHTTATLMNAIENFYSNSE